MQRFWLVIIIWLISTFTLSAQDTGSITIDAVQDQVTVYLNNEFYGIASGPSKIDNLNPGDYLIKIEKNNYSPWKKNVTIYNLDGTKIFTIDVRIDGFNEYNQIFFDKKNNYLYAGTYGKGIIYQLQ